MINIHNGSSGFLWHNDGKQVLPYLKKKSPIYGTFWLSSSIDHITLKREINIGVEHREGYPSLNTMAKIRGRTTGKRRGSFNFQFKKQMRKQG
jgi:hypothetical protein